MRKLTFYQDNLVEWRWNFRASNGRIIADSGEGYKNFVDCQHGFALFQDAMEQGYERVVKGT